jgi:hypothetical protein
VPTKDEQKKADTAPKKAATPAPNVKLKDGRKPRRDYFRTPAGDITYPSADEQRAGWYAEDAARILANDSRFQAVTPRRG